MGDGKKKRDCSQRNGKTRRPASHAQRSSFQLAHRYRYVKGITTRTEDDTKEGIRHPPKIWRMRRQPPNFGPVAEATAEVSAVAEIFDSEIRDSFRLYPANSHSPKLLDHQIGRVRRISICQTSKQKIATFSDTSFAKPINGWILFT